MKVLFLISDAFGIGGTIRTTFNLATVLADRGHDVEVLSALRHRDVPQLPLDPRVRLMSLLEIRQDHPDYDRTDPLRGKPVVVYPKDESRAHEYDLLAEDRGARYLRSSDADVVIATRPGLIAWTAAFAPERMIRIGQEHLTRRMHRKGLREEMAQHYRRLDAFVTVSARDAQEYRRHLQLQRTRLLFIPNSVPAPQVPPSDGARKIVVAAGRLVATKRFDVLIRAFVKVNAVHPDWQLRVYGGGDKLAQLRDLVVDLGLHNHVLMMGRYSPIEPEWAKGAIAAVPSDREPFGMTLVEAMRCGVPVVSTDAPHGPAEILADGVDGVLTPVGDPDAMADALLKLIEDPDRRRAMAAAALKNSARYDPEPVADRYEELFAELAADKARRSRSWWRWRQRLLRRHAPAADGAAVAVLGPALTVSVPVADCLVTAGGDVVVRLPVAALPHAPAPVWRHTGTKPRSEPAGPVVRDGDAWTLTVRAGDVPEGAWELHVGEDRPVLAGLRDTRALVDVDDPTDGGLDVRLPYRAATGRFCLRVWRRAVHPEVEEVHVDGDTIRFTGRLVGVPTATSPAALELRRRTPEEKTERVPVQRHGSARFTASVPVGTLAGQQVGEQDTWDLWLHFDEQPSPARVGRFLDDVVNKSHAYFFPYVAAGDTRVQPIYTAQNELSVRVTTVPR